MSALGSVCRGGVALQPHKASDRYAACLQCARLRSEQAETLYATRLVLHGLQTPPLEPTDPIDWLPLTKDALEDGVLVACLSGCYVE